MEQMKHLGSVAIWLSGHILSWLVLNLILLGGYQVWMNYQTYTLDAKKFVASLSESQQNDLAEQLFMLDRQFASNETTSPKRK